MRLKEPQESCSRLVIVSKAWNCRGRVGTSLQTDLFQNAAEDLYFFLTQFTKHVYFIAQIPSFFLVKTCLWNLFTQ